ncbi:hypothetical protein LV469_05700 [Peptoniphilus sp. GNH]|nr:hypothetical protein HMPREF3189_01202 [Clostridiales bacterium KA00134]UHR02142.1 hypothetical protein LV469_05700 [Peptoniphilus sp. GNH]
MKNLERKKYKRLGINFLILLVFVAQMLMVKGVSFSNSFSKSPYPLAQILDTYLFISLLINPILISSLVKKVMEIEEKNKMWQMQIILGEKVNSILLYKFKNLSFKLIVLQIIEALGFIKIAMHSDHFSLNSEMLLRFVTVNLSALIINLFFLGLFMIIEIKSKKVYTLSFISIIGGLTGVICMLTSKILTYLNPFAWMASLLNTSYIKEEGSFIQVLNPTNFYTLIIALILLIVCLGYLKAMKTYNLYKD